MLLRMNELTLIAEATRVLVYHLLKVVLYLMTQVVLRDHMYKATAEFTSHTSFLAWKLKGYATSNSG